MGELFSTWLLELLLLRLELLLELLLLGLELMLLLLLDRLEGRLCRLSEGWLLLALEVLLEEISMRGVSGVDEGVETLAASTGRDRVGKIS